MIKRLSGLSRKVLVCVLACCLLLTTMLPILVVGAESVVVVPNESSSHSMLQTYIMSADTPVYLTKEEFAVSVGYYPDGDYTAAPIDTLFDTFIFVSSPNYHFDSSQQYGMRVMDKACIEDFYDAAFAESYNLDALNEAVGELKEVLGNSDYKANVALSYYYAHPSCTDFGIVDGRRLDLSVEADRMAAMKWQVDEQLRRFDEKEYEHIQVLGFHLDTEVVPVVHAELLKMAQYVNAYAKSLGYETVISPYNAGDTYSERYKDAGFSRASLQINYFPKIRDPFTGSESGQSNTQALEAVERTADFTADNDMGIMLEWSCISGGISDPETEFDGVKYFKQYLEGGVKYGYMNRPYNSYQLDGGPGSIYDLVLMDDAYVKSIYGELYKFIKGTLKEEDIRWYDDFEKTESREVWAMAVNGYYDANNYTKAISLEVGATYTFSMMYRVMHGKACSVSIGNTILISGETPQNGAVYDAADGLLTYTFTAEGGTTYLSFNSCSGWQQAYTCIAVPTLRKLDKNGNVIDVVDCDPSFATWAKGWGTNYFVAEVDSRILGNHSAKDIVHYAAAKGNYNGNDFAKGLSLEVGETYRLTMLYKKIAGANCSVYLGDAELICGTTTGDGVLYDPVTGLLIYTFTADSSEMFLSLNGCFEMAYAETYIALPQIQKLDADGNVTATVDVDPTFATWTKGTGPDYLIGTTDVYLFGDQHRYAHEYDNDCDDECNRCGETRAVKHEYSSICDAECNRCGNIRWTFSHEYDDDADVVCNVCGASRELPARAIAVSMKNWYDSNNFSKTVSLEAGATYRFSLLYKKADGADCSFSVGSTVLISGTTAQNGATYDTTTGLLTYEFTAEGGEVQLSLNSCAGWTYGDTYIAAPTMRKLDETGKVIGIVDCDPAFLTWSKGWGTRYVVSDVDRSVFGTYVETDIINYAAASGDYDSNNFAKAVTLEAGETYRFTMLYKKVAHNDCSFSIGSTTLISGETAQNGATYDATTGELTYTFVAEGGEVYLALNSCASWWRAETYIAVPKLEKLSDGSEVDCDPNFASWTTGWGTAYPTGLIDGYLFGDRHPASCEHEYDNACDAECNRCGNAREIGDHVYDDVQDMDCNECGAIREASSSHIPGDINGDGNVNNRDVMTLNRYLNEWDVEVVEAALDVNGDGNVNNRDVMILNRYLNEWDVIIV